MDRWEVTWGIIYALGMIAVAIALGYLLLRAAPLVLGLLFKALRYLVWIILLPFIDIGSPRK